MPMDPWQLQPARDTGLTPAERVRSVRRESGLLVKARAFAERVGDQIDGAAGGHFRAALSA